MTFTRGRTTPSQQAGFALVEILVSALIAVLATGAVFKLMQATTRSAADQRKRSQAYAVAQEDQRRLRSMRLPSLNKFEESRPVTIGNTQFTVLSTASFANASTGLATCGSGSSSAGFVKIASKVTWPGMGATPAAEIRSIVAPPSGSLKPNSGTLTIKVTDAAEVGLAAIGLSGTGAGTFSGSTDSSGCASFPEQAAGAYTLTTSGGASGIVDTDGKPPGPRPITVNPGVTNSLTLQYAKPGSIPVRFKYRIGSSSSFSPAYPTSGYATTDSIIAFNSGMESGAKLFGTPGGTRKAELVATSIFPFTSKVTVYAGSCVKNDPGTGNEASASVDVPSGFATATQTVQLPALNLTVWSGKNSSNKGSAFDDADVWIEDEECEDSSGNEILRRYETNSNGNLSDPGLPWSLYDICVDDNRSSWNSPRRDTANDVSVKNLSSGTTLNLYLGSGTGSESESGSCS